MHPHTAGMVRASALTARLALALCPGAAQPLRALLDAHQGDAGAAVQAGEDAWALAGLGNAQRRWLRQPDTASARWQASCRWLDQPGCHLITWASADYPPLPAQEANPPLALFVCGEPGRLWHPQIAIVGSRLATPGALELAHYFALSLARAGLAITSGLAAGVDAAAHQGALEAGGLTLAVLGTGPDIVYPSGQKALHAAIAANGCLISEFPPGTPPRRAHFPRRNRIVAAMSLGTLVVEAGERSGALITARLAAESGREVFALPGSLLNPMAAGCHRLLRDGATLVTSPADILENLPSTACTLREALHTRLKADAAPAPDDPTQRRIWQALGLEATDIDSLLLRTQLPLPVLSAGLLALELEGRVQQVHGRYALTPPRLAP